MGTHCYIGIEYDDGIVEYIYIHFDGYFENIVPTLRQYTNREDVKKMIKYGFCALPTLQSLTDEQLNEHVEDYEPPKTVRGMHRLIEMSYSPFVPYLYVFSRDNEWMCCYTLGFFEMKYIKCESDHE